MTDEKKPLKIEFAPGCFDDFDGTQEELDELIAQITEIFTNNTPEEIEAMSQPVEFDELETEIQTQLINATSDIPPSTLH